MASQGQTTDPKTGKIYRLQPAKQRTPEFLRLSAEAESARVALVEYCNTRGYRFDIKSQTTVELSAVAGKTGVVPVKGDKTLNGLIEVHKKAKKALKDYKNSHKSEFQAPPKGKTSSKRGKAPTMQVLNKPESSG